MFRGTKEHNTTIMSSLQVVLGIEEDQRREEKLKLLSDLLGELSFPPPSLPRISSYSLVYVLYRNIFRGEEFFRNTYVCNLL